MEFARIYAFDAEYDLLDDVPAEVREHRRYKAHPDFTVQGVADQLVADFGERPLDIVIHSLANGPEVKNPLLQTSRAGYVSAVSQSSYSFVSLVQRMGPLLRDGGSFLSLTYMASERVVPGYGGGMSSAKAALESDTRVLAYEAGREFGARVNCISAGPWASRAASAIGFIGEMIDYARTNSPLPQAIHADEVGATAAFLASPLASGITGTIVYVDKGFHAMGRSVG
jgi:enoyl-[acyl-carrier protein] reductase I